MGVCSPRVKITFGVLDFLQVAEDLACIVKICWNGLGSTCWRIPFADMRRAMARRLINNSGESHSASVSGQPFGCDGL